MSAILAGLGKAAVSFLISLVMSFGQKEFIKWLFFFIADKIVKSTKTDHDDEFLKKVKESYEQYEGNE